MAKRAANRTRKSRSLEEREAFYQQKLKDIAVRKQIAALRQQIGPKSSKKQ
jgi:hypothetical protein